MGCLEDEFARDESLALAVLRRKHGDGAWAPLAATLAGYLDVYWTFPEGDNEAELLFCEGHRRGEAMVHWRPNSGTLVVTHALLLPRGEQPRHALTQAVGSLLAERNGPWCGRLAEVLLSDVPPGGAARALLARGWRRRTTGGRRDLFMRPAEGA